jgi:hypothetical protein
MDHQGLSRRHRIDNVAADDERTAVLGGGKAMAA